MKFLPYFNWQHQQALFKPFIILLMLGLIMVATASTSIATHYKLPAYHFMQRQIYYVIAAVFVLYATSLISIEKWQKYNLIFWGVSLLGLVLVLIPGIGHEVNGSYRWLNLGIIKIQASEVAKVAMVLFVAGFLVRRQGDIIRSWKAFLSPFVVMALMLFLLLKEPDFGAAFVLLGAVMMQLFLGGVKAGQFFLLLFLAAFVGVIALSAESYRVERLLAYLDPWAPENVYDIGYQLTQSLIAFGRGGWFGVGLGESVQKLFYLPEAHTDFVFAIWAEETGLVGALLALAVLVWLVALILKITWQAQAKQQMFAAYTVIGIATLFSLQIIINIGVNTGLLPTKGLTLPFYSYGGSSLLVCSAMLGIVMRVSYQTQSAPTVNFEVAYES